MMTAETVVLALALVLVTVVSNNDALPVKPRAILLLLALVAGILAALHRPG
jgi:hypothetical protein